MAGLTHARSLPHDYTDAKQPEWHMSLTVHDMKSLIFDLTFFPYDMTSPPSPLLRTTTIRSQLPPFIGVSPFDGAGRVRETHWFYSLARVYDIFVLIRNLKDRCQQRSKGKMNKVYFHWLNRKKSYREYKWKEMNNGLNTGWKIFT